MPEYTRERRSAAAQRGWRAEEITEIQAEYLDWYVDAERQGSQAQWARDHGIRPDTITQWKKNAKFREAWDAKLKEYNIGPDRTQTLIDRLYENGKQGDVKAIELYLKFIEKLSPPTVVVQRNASDLSDEELAAAMADRLDRLNGEG